MKKHNSGRRNILVAGLVSPLIFFLLTDNSIASYGCPGYYGHLPWIKRLENKGGQIIPIIPDNYAGGSVSIKETKCSKDFPPINTPRETLVRLKSEYEGDDYASWDTWGDGKYAYEYEQSPVGCIEHSGFIYFGISFYHGEGVVGVGGIGRYSIAEKKMEVRRPKQLLGSSVPRIIPDGDHFWLATVRHTEGGEVPTLGLVKYDWGKDEVTTFIDNINGPCGFEITDLLYDNGYVWASHDLGVSKYNTVSKRWKNYRVDATTEKEMHLTSCDKLYRQLLDSLPETFDRKGFGACAVHFGMSARDAFLRYLYGFQRKYIATLPEDITRLVSQCDRTYIGLFHQDYRVKSVTTAGIEVEGIRGLNKDKLLPVLVGGAFIGIDVPVILVTYKVISVENGLARLSYLARTNSRPDGENVIKCTGSFKVKASQSLGILWGRKN